MNKNDLKKISDYIFEIPKNYMSGMRVPARILVSEDMLDDVFKDSSLKQLINVAHLPGIQRFALAMPDVHEGYGFPIGGVAAMAIDEGGVISPGGIGYDINCGVRLLASNLYFKDIKDRLNMIADIIYKTIPSGTGKGGKIVLTAKKLDAILEEGASYIVKNLDLGNEDDLIHCEERGVFLGASAEKVSQRAKDRGIDQLATLGSGNHFLEIQEVEGIYNEKAAKELGLFLGQITVMIHCGSRGLGHQVCSDYVSLMLKNQQKWSIDLPDRELASAPFYDELAQDYFKAMKAAANFAFANRHAIGAKVRAIFEHELKNAHVKTLYDVCHNIGKLEKHIIDGVEKNLLVHRKGATRAFKDQPVLIPGTMGTASYVLMGTSEAMDISFGSSCHGAGRSMSRMKAKKTFQIEKLRKDFVQKGILIKADKARGLLEEAPLAYKDVDEVVNVIEGAGIAKIVARLKPRAVIKGD